MYAIDNHCMMSVFVNKVIWKVGKYKYIVLEINNKHIVGQKQDYGSAQIILENAINDYSQTLNCSNFKLSIPIHDIQYTKF